MQEGNTNNQRSPRFEQHTTQVYALEVVLDFLDCDVRLIQRKEGKEEGGWRKEERSINEEGGRRNEEGGKRRTGTKHACARRCFSLR